MERTGISIRSESTRSKGCLALDFEAGKGSFLDFPFCIPHMLQLELQWFDEDHLLCFSKMLYDAVAVPVAVTGFGLVFPHAHIYHIVLPPYTLFPPTKDLVHSHLVMRAQFT